MTRIWIDVGDLFKYASSGQRPSGIQRLEFELCCALNALPESNNVTDACRVIRATIEDQAGLRQWRERVRREFRPVAWSASARAVLRTLDGEVDATKLRWSA